MPIRNKLFHSALLVAASALAAGPAGAAMTLSPGSKKGAPPSEASAPSASPAQPTASASGGVSASSPASTPATPMPGQLQPPKKTERVGSVIYVGGAGVVGEIKGGARAKERFRLYDSGSRLRGEVLAVKALDEATFVLEPIGATTASMGDRLVRVSE